MRLRPMTAAPLAAARLPACSSAVIVVLGALMAAPPAQAQPIWSVTLPDVSHLDRTAAEALMTQLARISVVTTNCPKWAVDDPTWALITGTGDQLAMQLGIDPAAYDATYFGPAFAELDDPAACDRIGPEAAPLIERLAGMGGSARNGAPVEDAEGGKDAPDRKAASRPDPDPGRDPGPDPDPQGVPASP